MQKIANLKGLTYAAISSSTFGLAPFFSIRLLNEGFSPFEVLSYRWGTASLALLAFGLLTGVKFHMESVIPGLCSCSAFCMRPRR